MTLPKDRPLPTKKKGEQTEIKEKPIHEKLSGLWSGESIHKETGDKTVWDDVQLAFTPEKSDDTSAQIGKVVGTGNSLWFASKIPFTIEGTYDIKTASMVCTKTHTGKYNNTIKYNLTLSIDTMTITSKEPNLTLRRTREVAVPSEIDLCKVCMDKAINSIILPCAHMCCCMECGAKLKNCPLCRGDIKEVKLVYRG